MRTGPLGSTIHVLHADSQTVVELASIDWNRSFRRVCLDPVRGLITLVVPSRLHEEFSAILGHVVDIAASALADAAKDLRNARLREPGSPPGTGMEPDCAFYLGACAVERNGVSSAAEAPGTVGAGAERGACDAFGGARSLRRRKQMRQL